MRPSVLDGPGVCWIDRIVADCLARRLSAEEMRIRLEVALIAARVLEEA